MHVRIHHSPPADFASYTFSSGSSCAALAPAKPIYSHLQCVESWSTSSILKTLVHFLRSHASASPHNYSPFRSLFHLLRSHARAPPFTSFGPMHVHHLLWSHARQCTNFHLLSSHARQCTTFHLLWSHARAPPPPPLSSLFHFLRDNAHARPPFLLSSLCFTSFTFGATVLCTAMSGQVDCLPSTLAVSAQSKLRSTVVFSHAG